MTTITAFPDDLPDPAEVAAALAEAARIEAAADRSLMWARWHYARGDEDGYRRGRADEAASLAAAWSSVAARFARPGPTFAELQRRRYGTVRTCPACGGSPRRESA